MSECPLLSVANQKQTVSKPPSSGQSDSDPTQPSGHDRRFYNAAIRRLLRNLAFSSETDIGRLCMLPVYTEENAVKELPLWVASDLCIHVCFHTIHGRKRTGWKPSRAVIPHARLGYTENMCLTAVCRPAGHLTDLRRGRHTTNPVGSMPWTETGIGRFSARAGRGHAGVDHRSPPSEAAHTVAPTMVRPTPRTPGPPAPASR